MSNTEKGNRKTESTAWLRSIWAVLTRPLPGTQARSEQIWIEGRLNKLQFLAVMLLAVVPLAGFLMRGHRLGIKALTEAADARLCEPGLGGYSLGGEILVAMVMLVVLPALIPFVCLLVASWRMYKRQRNVPLGYRPWLSMQLIEGRAAVRRGVGGMICAAAGLILMLGGTMWIISGLSESIIVPPAKIAECQPPHSHKAASSEPLASIPEKP